MAKPLFKLCKQGLHEQTYENTFVDYRGYTICRPCFNAAHRRYYRRRRERKGAVDKRRNVMSPEQINHYKVCRLLGLSLDSAIYLVGISEWEGKKLDRTMDVRPVLRMYWQASGVSMRPS